jgi:predicted SAM-dependent methyltransferase
MGIVSIMKSFFNSDIRPHDLRNMGKSQHMVRIIVGAAEDSYEGWIATEKDQLSLLQEADWAYHFESNPVDAILAEHVWEHLDCSAAIVAAQNCFKYLKPGGYMRVAVPDGLHPDDGYIDHVKPGGSGAGADDHRVLYTYRTLKTVYELVGFEVLLLEYFDERGTFHYLDWSPTDGMITRSKRFDSRNRTRELAYTSIILDARKPV